MSKQGRPKGKEPLLPLPEMADELGLGGLYGAIQRVFEPFSPVIEQMNWLFEPLLRNDLAANESSPPKEGE